MLFKFLKHNFSIITVVFCTEKRKRNRHIPIIYRPEISRHKTNNTIGKHYNYTVPKAALRQISKHKKRS